MSAEIGVIAVIMVVACSISGVFLVLRNMSMIADAVSHTVLLGIVIGYMFTKNINSPWLMIGATIVGVLTVWLVERVSSVQKINADASIGLVFPMLFSVAIIIITKFASSVHLDVDAVMLGELVYAPFDRFIINGIDVGAKGIYIGVLLLLINVLFIKAYKREMVISTFDKTFAKIVGIKTTFMHYIYITIVSITIVGAFNVMGSILVIAFMVIPVSVSMLVTNNIDKILILSSIIAGISGVLGYVSAIVLDVSIAGMMAVTAGIVFGIIFIIKNK